MSPIKSFPDSLASPPAIVEQDDRRAKKVLDQITALAKKESLTALELAKLLSEARREKYPQKMLGMPFDEWVDQANLGIGRRQARYYADIWDGADALSISEDELEDARMTKLKSIFVLDIEQFQEEIRDLVKRAPEMTVAEMNEEVKQLKEVGEDDFSWLNVPILTEDKDEHVGPAMAVCRTNNGQTIDVRSKEGKDLSDGACLAIICQAYLQDPNNQAEEIGERGSFQDSVEVGDLPEESV